MNGAALRILTSYESIAHARRGNLGELPCSAPPIPRHSLSLDADICGNQVQFLEHLLSILPHAVQQRRISGLHRLSTGRAERSGLSKLSTKLSQIGENAATTAYPRFEPWSCGDSPLHVAIGPNFSAMMVSSVPFLVWQTSPLALPCTGTAARVMMSHCGYRGTCWMFLEV
jgi:hypothetical protein